VLAALEEVVWSELMVVSVECVIVGTFIWSTYCIHMWMGILLCPID